jgi:DNA repair photolyase
MGTNVDCYQRAEGRYRLMPEIIGALADADTPFSILTKGTLILRDLEVLTGAAERVSVRLSMSVGFLDEPLWRSVEAGTPSPARRLEAVRTMSESGIGCGVLMAPILPYLSDSRPQLRATVAAIAQAGARSVTPLVLHLRPGAREWFLSWLGENHPELVSRYRALYGTRSYAPKWYQNQITDTVRLYAQEFGLAPSRSGEARNATQRRNASRTRWAAAGSGGPASRDHGEQLTLM